VLDEEIYQEWKVDLPISQRGDRNRDDADLVAEIAPERA
jgi:hypothetical protein